MKIEKLQIYYDSFINQNEKRYFLRGMADYIELLLNDSACKDLISRIPRLKSEFLLENANTEKIAKVKRRVFKKEFKDVLEGTEFDPFGDINAGNNVYYLKNYSEVTEIERKIRDGEGATLWDAWNKMCLAYLSIFKSEDVITNPKKRDEYDKWIIKNNADLVKEVGQLERYDKKGKKRLMLLDVGKKDYKPYVYSIHNYLIKELSSYKTQESEKLKMTFDVDNGILNIGDKSVRVKKMGDQHHLLRVLFQDREELFREWFFSEIGECIDNSSPYNDKKIYNISYQLNNKIARDTGIKNFFITTRQSLIINKKKYNFT